VSVERSELDFLTGGGRTLPRARELEIRRQRRSCTLCHFRAEGLELCPCDQSL
jgi:hypothetical protein